jgi:hypothetical protein
LFRHLASRTEAPEEALHRVIFDPGNRQWDISAQRELFQKLTTRNTRVDGFEMRHNSIISAVAA